MWHTQLPCDGFSSPHPSASPTLPPFSYLFLELCSLRDVSDCAHYYYGMSDGCGRGERLYGNCGCYGRGWWGVCMEEWGRDCSRGRGELTIMVCTLQGNYAEWGRGDWSVRMCVWMGGILWDACPLISLCVWARARGVCVVCEGEKGDGVVRTRCHKNTEIYLNWIPLSKEKELPSIDWQSKWARSYCFWKLFESSCKYRSFFFCFNCLQIEPCRVRRLRLPGCCIDNSSGNIGYSCVRGYQIRTWPPVKLG